MRIFDLTFICLIDAGIQRALAVKLDCDVPQAVSSDDGVGVGRFGRRS